MEKVPKKPEKPIELIDLDISVRLLNFLRANFGIRTLKELSEKTENEIRSGMSFNPKHLSEINELLISNGLSLKKEN